jgi:hypothetical protein
MESSRYVVLYFLVVLNIAKEISCVQVSNYTWCKQQAFSSDSFVCVCTDSYCDAFDNRESKPLTNNNFAVYTSSKDGARFELSIGEISPHFDEKEDSILLYVDETQKYQEIIGFGGAFTGIFQFTSY